MTTLHSVYMMAFMPEIQVEDRTLIAVCQMAADRLAVRNKSFDQRLKMLAKDTRIDFSHRAYAPHMYTAESMERSLKTMLQQQNVPAPELRIGDNFFPHVMRDPQGRENYFLYYFDLR